MTFSTITTQNGVYLQTENNELVTLIRIIKIAGNKTNDKYICVNVVGLNAVELGAAISYAKKHGIRNPSLSFAQIEADMMVANLENRLCALEAFADLLNAALHTDIANAAKADAAQCEVEQAIIENDAIDFVQVYIDGMPNDWASVEVAKYCLDYFLNPDLAVNTLHTFNGAFLYLQETILDTCFDHQNGVWEFWANPAFPDEKTLLMIYLSTSPVKARKSPKYPHELDYADGGDGYTSENLVLDF